MLDWMIGEICERDVMMSEAGDNKWVMGDDGTMRIIDFTSDKGEGW